MKVIKNRFSLNMPFYLHTLTRAMDYWLNFDLSTMIAKLHEETCIYCEPYDQHTKDINEMNSSGGWFKFESPIEAEQYYRGLDIKIFWQPCKVCKPE